MTTAERRATVRALFPDAEVRRYASGWAVVSGLELLSGVAPSCTGVDALWLSAYNVVVRRALQKFRGDYAAHD